MFTTVMRILVVILVSCVAVVSYACNAPAISAVTVSRLDAVKDFRMENYFQFSISPDDRWLVYFATVPTPSEEIDYRYGFLRVLDLRTSTVHSFQIRESDAPAGLDDGQGVWAPDSSHCLLEPPLRTGRNVQSALLINVDAATGSVQAASVKAHNGEKPKVTVPNGSYEVLDSYTCSDCSPHLNDVELMKKHIDRKYLSSVGGRDPNTATAQMVSHDGTKIYFQKGPELGVHSEQTTLFELDIATGKERQLVTHNGACAKLNRLRPSPDGKRLAYQLSTGCSFMAPTRLFILDLQSLEETEIKKEPAYGMHWSSDSAKLYFASEGYLHVAEIGKN